MTTLVPKSPALIAGVVFVLAMTLVGIFAPVVAPHDPQDQQLPLRHLPPMSTGVATDRTADPPLEETRFFLLGTDHLGRDYLSRILFALRTNVVMGALNGAVALGLAAGAGLLLGSLPRFAQPVPEQRRSALAGILDYSSLRLSCLTLVVGFPGTLIGLFVLGPSFTNLVIVTAIFSIVLPVSLMYQSLKIASTIAQGDSAPASSPWLALRIWLFLVPVSFSLAVLMTLIMVFPLSFLGFGIQPPEMSLGLLMSQGRQYVVTAWWVTFFPMVIFLIAVGAFLGIVLPIRRVQKQSDLFVQPDSMGMSYAGFWVRMASITIDGVALIFVVIISAMLIGISGLPEVLWVGFPILALLYPFVFLGGCRDSLGHRLLQIRVVSSNGERVGIGRSIIRSIIRGFLIMICNFIVFPIAPIINVLAIGFSRRRRALYDMLSDTVVVKQRHAQPVRNMMEEPDRPTACPQCGSQVVGDSNFCSQCGADLAR